MSLPTVYPTIIGANDVGTLQLIPPVVNPNQTILKANANATVSTANATLSGAADQVIGFATISALGIDIIESNKMVISMEFGFDLDGITTPAFALSVAANGIASNITQTSRDYVSSNSNGYFSGVVSFVLQQGVDYDPVNTSNIAIMTSQTSTSNFSMPTSNVINGSVTLLTVN